MEESNKSLQEENDQYQLTILQKRQKAIGMIFLIVFTAIAARLFWIQIVMNESYLKKAASQRQYEFQTSINRGAIFDRNMIPFTDRQLKKFIAITPYVTDKEGTAEVVSEASGLSKKEILTRMQESSGNIEIEAREFSNDALASIEKGMVKGVSVLEKKVRYTEDSLARHVLGYIGKSDLNGVMGIEKSMNRLLDQGGAEKIVAIVDSHKSVIPSLGFRKIETNGTGENYGVKLTLDYHIQQIAEEVLKKNKINGSAVVMDIKNGEILAMASVPDFDPNNVGSYLKNTQDELVNKAVTAYDFGSIFKTVVAAAAIENHLVDFDETFLCKGEIEVNKSMIKCSTYSTHENRPLTFQEAFALSCNTTFIKVGMRVGADKILEMAKRMGYSEKQCSELLEEKAGYIPTGKEDGIGNISIGQGKIQVTPLQVTTMMAAIANNGIRNMPVIVDAVVDNETGKVVQTMSRSKPAMILSTETVKKLQEMLRAVTVSGTAKQANLDKFGGSSGKTSTAETGIQNGTIIHGWFAGYTPSDNPRYAITVMVYNGRSGAKSAAPIFKEIAYRIFTEYKPVD
jgi:penicillin-binding protein 2